MAKYNPPSLNPWEIQNPALCIFEGFKYLEQGIMSEYRLWGKDSLDSKYGSTIIYCEEMKLLSRVRIFAI